MAFSGYSTVLQLRNNVAKAENITEISDADVQDRITEADKLIKTKLSKLVDFDLVPADCSDATFPDWLNKLSQFKTAELVLVRMFGAKRSIQDITDITYWKDEYLELLTEIQNGEIALELADGTDLSGGTDTISIGRQDVRPALGMGEHGGFVSDDTLAEERPTGQDYDDDYDV